MGYYYATPKAYVEQQLRRGRSVALCLDLRGALRLKRMYGRKTITIFVQPPSVDALQLRIAKRCQKTRKEEVCQRLGLARQEMATASQYDYCVLNSDLRQAVSELKQIVVREMHMRERGSLR